MTFSNGGDAGLDSGSRPATGKTAVHSSGVSSPSNQTDGGSSSRHPPLAHLGRYSQYGASKMEVLRESGAVDQFTRSTMMLQYLYRRFREQGWLETSYDATDGDVSLGFVMQVDPSEEDPAVRYVAEPRGVTDNLKLIAARLNLAVLATMSSDITNFVFGRMDESDTELLLRPNHITVPIVESFEALANSETIGASVTRRDFCCCVRRERVVLVWSRSGEEIMLHASDVESKLMGSIWGATIPDTPARIPLDPVRTPPGMTPFQTYNNGRTPHRAQSLHSRLESTMGGSNNSDEKGLAVIDNVDLGAEDDESLRVAPRPFLLTQSVMVGMAMCLLVVIECAAVRLILAEVHALGVEAMPRLAILATIPMYMWFAVFFTIVLVGCLFQLVGPIGDVKYGNSRFYSSRAPDIKRHRDIEWPHITIQMPVYKEGLKGVIIPTINSLLAAIRHYESLGGTASIFVCEDGMQAVKPEVAEMRKQFYRINGIGWCARPPHKKDGFQRKGKFKKASNMNYGLNFSLRVEDELLRLIAGKSERENRTPQDITIEEEEELYQEAVEKILEDDGGKTMAEGNVRMGEVILIIDCDTRVPVNCLSLGAMEMEESPEVAIIQHASGVMQVIHTVFENAITYFTNLIYLLIRFSVGSGDYAPFVGHNAFLRWKAIQSVSFEEDGVTKFWSESHVSEDFDMSLRLQTAGFVVRMATYDNGEFKEGVSLTAFDELLRWEKYAYGCSELIFHPMYQWIYRGPFTELFIRFLGSNMKVSAKFTIIGYIGTYYAIGGALPLSLANYFLTGWIADTLDHSYLTSWYVLCSTLFVFLGLSPISFAWYRQRLGVKNFFWALLEAYTWMPFFVIFFGGLSWHISYSLLAHMFCLPIEWSSTAKELESGGFFVGMERVAKQFKWVVLAMLVLIGGIVYLAVYAPDGWQISEWTIILPLALQITGHIGLPIFTILF